jgi:hypothetical protein
MVVLLSCARCQRLPHIPVTEDVISMRRAPGRIPRGIALFLVSAALLPVRAPAQTKLALHGGDRLRLTREARGPQSVYWLRDLRGDTLLVSKKRDSAALAFAPSDLLSMETRVPRTKGQGALRGFGLGVLLGGATGIVTGAILGSGPGCGGQSGSELCFNPGSVVTGLVLGLFGGAAGGLVGTVAGAIEPGKRWAEVELPLRADFTPGFPPPAPITRWSASGGAFMVMDDKWDPGFQVNLSMRRSSRRQVQPGIILYCDLWRPAPKAPEESAVTWESSGLAWLIGLAPTVRFSPWDPAKGDPRVYLELTAGLHAIVSSAEMLEYGRIYGRAPEHIDLMDAPLGMRADAGIGWSTKMGGFEPEVAVKLHGVLGKAESASTFMLELGVGF